MADSCACMAKPPQYWSTKVVPIHRHSLLYALVVDIASWLCFLWLRSPFVHCHQICCCCCSFAKSCPTLCSPTNCSMPGFPVLHYFPEFVQTLIHWVSDVIQPSHPLLLPFPLALNLSQHQALYQWIGLCISGQSIGASASASVLPMNTQDWFPLG